MSAKPIGRRGGFTIAELLIGVSLSLMVMTAVLSSYVFVARSYSKTIGFGQPNQPTLESQGRRTLAYFEQDVAVTSAITAISPGDFTPMISSSVPLSQGVKLTVPRGNGATKVGGTKTVIYYFNSGTSAVTLSGVAVAAKTLVRIDPESSTVTNLTLHSSLLTCVFSYFDSSGHPYTTFTDYLPGIKQTSLALTAQSGSSVNGTQSSVYKVASPRMLFRNKSILP